jgi:hypothetical protein
VIPLSAVEHLRSIGQVSPELLEAVIGYLGDGNEWAAERLSREPGWVIDSALRSGSSKVFAAHLTQLDGYEIADLRLGKKTEALLDEAATLHKQLDRYAYGAPAVRFTESDVDQARAAGVLVEFENARPIIVDRSLYRELCKQAIKRTVEDLRVRVAEVAQERKAAKASGRPVDPEAEARRERGRALRAIAEQAHGANLDLGWGLMNGLATVDPADMAVAKFFVLGRCRPSTNWADVATMPMRRSSTARQESAPSANQRGGTVAPLAPEAGQDASRSAARKRCETWPAIAAIHTARGWGRRCRSNRRPLYETPTAPDPLWP